MRRLASLLLLCLTITGAHAAGPAPQSFVVYFSEWSAALDDSANGIVGHAADFAKEHPHATIAVNGFASTVGSRKANDLLADLRAQVVVDQLLADSVPASRIHQRGHGPKQYALTPQESRRVEISVSDR
jgi:outer membrane protein OmpA-like peptidoglycan-associated protein